MMKRMMYFMLFSWMTLAGCAQTQSQQAGGDSRYFRPLTSEEKRVILHKGTERAFTGKYDKFYEAGTYVCKRCGAELYHSSDKFDSGCGWPSFDDEVEGAVNRVPDGLRTEITCASCDAHLGHVFLNEGFTAKNTRHCVNSISLEFIPAGTPRKTASDTAYFAGGCFWGVEYYLEQAPGVKSVESGYMGGSKKNPSYQEVSYHKTGHAEVVRVIFNPSETDYESLARLFFEIHDPTQVNRQGPDVGDQYRSEIFYRTVEQKEIAEKLIRILEKKGYDVATRLSPAASFWLAEDYHQNYYVNKGGTPYCHKRVQRF
ncbi:bifunctional methionine sulfoxide reductase B/A protein [uncultured Sunxiuqinia sp.]|uniref:bifunctional methionine sulfoxide reductase B/A protein n=1 Tax=uncultured Sunxiuqinia sp. TaxID=1573825 RepID=UPI0026264CD3|nr:bifunctional methionine sulfoxide reductase B/A protein [uncultured Sunxiuqinia sp.]